MLIDAAQNTPENGYGDPSKEDVNKEKAELLGVWARFYDEPYFKTYDEIKQSLSDRYKLVTLRNKSDIIAQRPGISFFLDTQIYKKRLKFVLEPFFHDANQRGHEYNQQVYCQVVGLGLGTWAVRGPVEGGKANYEINAIPINTTQEQIFFDTCVEILSQNAFPYISDVDFGGFEKLAKIHNLSYKQDKTFTLKSVNSESNSDILLHISTRDTADKLNDNKLLVAMYDWNGNAYPGNTYWFNHLASSGAVAACCSTITELQNPLINSNVSHKRLQMYR